MASKYVAKSDVDFDVKNDAYSDDTIREPFIKNIAKYGTLSDDNKNEKHLIEKLLDKDMMSYLGSIVLGRPDYSIVVLYDNVLDTKRTFSKYDEYILSSMKYFTGTLKQVFRCLCLTLNNVDSIVKGEIDFDTRSYDLVLIDEQTLYKAQLMTYYKEPTQFNKVLNTDLPIVVMSYRRGCLPMYRSFDISLSSHELGKLGYDHDRSVEILKHRLEEINKSKSLKTYKNNKSSPSESWLGSFCSILCSCCSGRR